MELLIATGDIPKLNHGQDFSVCCIRPAQPVFCLTCQFAMKRKMLGALAVDMTDTFHFLFDSTSVLLMKFYM